MKVLGIAASPRRNGNSEILLDKVLEGASSKGAETEKIVTDELDIRPCRSEDSCRKDGKCFVDDDMGFILKKLKEADGVVVASPVYFGSLPGQLKVIIDRCQPIWVDRFILKKKRIAKTEKKGIFISTSSYKRQKFFRNSQEIIGIFFLVLGIEFFKSIYAPNLESAGEVLKKKSLLDKAFRCGAGLVSCAASAGQG